MAGIGPAIGPCCYIVGADVRAAFDDRQSLLEHGRLDLWEANRRLLTSAGVAEAAIDAHPPCTMCEPDRFFSFRRDGAGIGQHLSFVVAAPAGA